LSATTAKPNKKDDTPLFQGAIQHLRSSLKTFELTTTEPMYASYARQTLINIAVQSGRLSLVNEEVDDLLSLLVHDKMNYGCDNDDEVMVDVSSGDGGGVNDNNSKKERKKCCPHVTRGEAFTNLIMRYNGSRYYSDGIFTRRTLMLLTDALQYHVTSITTANHHQDTTQKNKKGGRSLDLPPTCFIVTSGSFFILFFIKITNNDYYCHCYYGRTRGG